MNKSWTKKLDEKVASLGNRALLSSGVQLLLARPIFLGVRIMRTKILTTNSGQHIDLVSDNDGLMMVEFYKNGKLQYYIGAGILNQINKAVQKHTKKRLPCFSSD